MKHCCIVFIGLFFCASTVATDTSYQKKHSMKKESSSSKPDIDVGNLECSYVTRLITDECKLNRPYCFPPRSIQKLETDSFDRCRTLQYRIRDNPHLRHQITPQISDILFQCAKNPVGLNVSDQNKIDSFLGLRSATESTS
jgi:hypothetical protein